MKLDPLKTVSHTKPFIPFTICMADGNVFRIEHPEFLSIFPSGRYAIVFQDDDSHSILDVAMITELKVDPPQQTRAAG
jgi:hypothetical protein